MYSTSNRTFANFFHEELGVDIYDDRWNAQGNSKANRLRCYLQRAARNTALQTLEAFLFTITESSATRVARMRRARHPSRRQSR